MNDGIYGSYEVKDGILVGFGQVVDSFEDQFGLYINYTNGNVFIDRMYL